MEADSVDPANFPKVADHRKRMSERPQVREALDAQTPKRAA
jgi:glutathione S-transferase